MKTHTIENYLDLIQKLLNCPQGDEWRLIEQYEELIDPELLQVMERAIEELAREGDLRSANFLRHWQAQLARLLQQTAKVSPPKNEGKTRAYLDLIQALLRCPKGSELEILEVNQNSIDSGLIQTMRQMAAQTEEQGDRETANFLNYLATQIEQNYLRTSSATSKSDKNISESDNNSIDSNPTVEDLVSSEDPWIQRDVEEERRSKPKQPDEEISASISQLNPTSGDSLANSSSQSETTKNPTIEQQLTAIALSLKKLEEILVSRPQPVDPLWYMNVLERASASQWILTTEEIEKLTGVKPKCKANQNSYQRGCWLFVKAGKMGAQRGWHVIKQHQDFSRN
jgi:hypothetical protein